MNWLEAISASAGVATVIGVGAIAWQVNQSEQHQGAAFELRFSDRYDLCVARIPLGVLLNEVEYDSHDEKTRRAFYDYFELCEQECFYRGKGAISDSTWKDWEDGILTNLNKASFRAAWLDIGSVAETQFEEFRRMFPQGHAH